MATDRVEVAQPSGREVVECDDVIAAGEERLDEV
jgi:orotate phosphoribosyltransferase